MSRTPRPNHRAGAALTALLPPLLAAACAAAPLHAQDDRGDFRVGIRFGGTSLTALTLEWFDGRRALEMSVGTWRFRDVGVSVVAKEFFGASALRPSVGAGLWLMIAPPPEALPAGSGTSRTPVALLARAPIGGDWRIGGGHAVGAEISITRALWIRRPSPEDLRPLGSKLVPIPALSYRWRP